MMDDEFDGVFEGAKTVAQSGDNVISFPQRDRPPQGRPPSSTLSFDDLIGLPKAKLTHAIDTRIAQWLEAMTVRRDRAL